MRISIFIDILILRCYTGGSEYITLQFLVLGLLLMITFREATYKLLHEKLFLERKVSQATYTPSNS